VVQFSRRNKLWPDHETSGIAALIFFGFVAIVMVWRLRSRVFSSRLLLLWLLFAAARHLSRLISCNTPIRRLTHVMLSLRCQRHTCSRQQGLHA
jgi:hypothetical protein